MSTTLSLACEVLPAISGIYFIECTGHGLVKIGWSENVPRRLKQLQAGCPFVLRIVGFMPGFGSKDESVLHYHLQRDRVRGEWFRMSKTVRRYIAKHASGDLP